MPRPAPAGGAWGAFSSLRAQPKITRVRPPGGLCGGLGGLPWRPGLGLTPALGRRGPAPWLVRAERSPGALIHLSPDSRLLYNGAQWKNASLNVLPATSSPWATVSGSSATSHASARRFTALSGPTTHAATRAVGGDDENFAGRYAVGAARGRSLGRFLPNILWRVCRVSLVQHSVSVKGY